jgi:putative membrane protein
MNSSSIGSVLLLACPLALLACSHDDKPAATGYEPAMTPAAHGSPSAPGTLGNESSEKLDDAQVVTVLRAVNVSEVDQARTVSGKVQDPSVKKFAEMMIAQHGQAVKDIDELSSKLGYKHEDSQLATELGVRATRMDQDLSQAEESRVDRLYIMDQIDAHRQALDTIDSRLVPAARHDDVKNLLQKMRPVVADHLQMAQQILASLK